MRYALGVEYDGSDFKGWQQLGESGCPSVQATLQDALSSVANAPVSVVCAGRTDAGVHGECQVVHFDSDVAREPRGWVLGTTTRLPPSVCVRWCVPVAEDFHARFSAKARRYRYRLLNRQVRPALYRQSLSWERRPLDADAMHRAAQALLGENDFSSFRSIQCQVCMRGASCNSSPCAALVRWWKWRCRPTPSCTTWCATSSVRCCWSAAVKSRSTG